MIDKRIQELEEEAVLCEDCAAKFASGQMVLRSNDVPFSGDEMAKKYRGYASNCRDLIRLYKEHYQ